MAEKTISQQLHAADVAVAKKLDLGTIDPAVMHIGIGVCVVLVIFAIVGFIVRRPALTMICIALVVAFSAYHGLNALGVKISF